MRLDLLLCRLRFVRTRSMARELVESGHLRINANRVARVSHGVAPGDVLTIARGHGVIVARVERLPERRGPPAEARSCYSLLDRPGTQPLAAPQETTARKDTAP